jgi:hypothetical protein
LGSLHPVPLFLDALMTAASASPTTRRNEPCALRGIALGRKSWLFAGSDGGGQRAAAMYSLIVTAKMNDIDPQARLADVLARIAEHPARDIDALLPWNWWPRFGPQGRASVRHHG